MSGLRATGICQRGDFRVAPLFYLCKPKLMSIQLDHGRASSWTFSIAIARQVKMNLPPARARAGSRRKSFSLPPGGVRSGKVLRHCRITLSWPFLFLVSAAQLLPDRADVKALAGRALLAQGQAEFATRAISRRHGGEHPVTPACACCYGKPAASPSKLSGHAAQHDSCPLARNQRTPRSWRKFSKLLAAQADAPTTVGVAHYLEERRESPRSGRSTLAICKLRLR